MKKTFSISYKWAIILTVMVIILLSVGLLINKLFFYDYYLYKEKQEIFNFAVRLNENYDQEDKVFGIINEFVVKKQASVRLYSESDAYDFSFSIYMNSDMMGKGNGHGNKRNINLPHGVELDLTSEGYVFFDFEHDDIRTQLLGLVYELDNGDVLLVSLPFEGLNKTADIAMQFNVYIVLILLAVAIVIVMILARRMTKPIIQLSQITQKISDLDFSESYIGHTNDEIHSLGEHINSMSHSLESALTDLQVANSKLLEDIKEKERNVEMRKNLIANVSHELKTPIALIMSYSEGLRENDSLDDERKAYYLNVISNETEHMDNLVRDLLDLTELEYDAFQLDKSEFDISSLIDVVIDRYAYLIKEKQLKLVLDKDDIIKVSGDVRRLEQAITNLIINAIEYTPEKGCIEITVVSDEKTKVMIKNTGSHIDENDLNKIWTSFFASDKKKRKIGGSGIGLSIVKAIIEKHEGSYGAYNDEDGVVFYLEI